MKFRIAALLTGLLALTGCGASASKLRAPEPSRMRTFIPAAIFARASASE